MLGYEESTFQRFYKLCSKSNFLLRKKDRLNISSPTVSKGSIYLYDEDDVNEELRSRMLADLHIFLSKN